MVDPQPRPAPFGGWQANRRHAKALRRRVLRRLAVVAGSLSTRVIRPGTRGTYNKGMAYRRPVDIMERYTLAGGWCSDLLRAGNCTCTNYGLRANLAVPRARIAPNGRFAIPAAGNAMILLANDISSFHRSASCPPGHRCPRCFSRMLAHSV